VHERVNACYRSASGRPAGDEEVNAEGIWSRPVVTEVAPLTVFYPAEEYHHRYFERNPYQGYCQVTIPPKLNKLHKQFSELLKSHNK